MRKNGDPWRDSLVHAAQSSKGGSERVWREYGPLPATHNCCRRPGFAHLQEGKAEGVFKFGYIIPVFKYR